MVLPPKVPDEQQAERDARERGGSFSGVRLEAARGFPSYEDIPQWFKYTVVDLLKHTRELQKTHGITGAKVRSSSDGSSNIATASTKNFEDSTGTSKVIDASPGWNSTAGWLHKSAEVFRWHRE